MKQELIPSLIGIIAFSAVMYLAYRYANGNWNVSEPKKAAYENWTAEYGRKAKR
ncbi:hypothetical protein QQ020_07730 [Fulvivirgaceae bacterium BMA12]|uniref:Phage protein n=1 Tax=Agaribacillus aureus TaxID=3051825 RepID=A0ABT8L3V8_9BACT|nr:hypothetical protein [Fulvivirgaceae bacterium BMA12]